MKSPGFLSGYTSLEKSWVVYDIGNSAFTLLVTTLIPIWFNALCENAGMSSIDYQTGGRPGMYYRYMGK